MNSFTSRVPFRAPRPALLLGTAVIAGCMIAGASFRAPVMAQDATAAATTDATSSVSASTTAIVDAANTFIASLDDTQKSEGLFDFDDTDQRTNWSNFPTGLFNRSGLSYASLSDDQRVDVMALLKVALSDEGYQKVMNIMTGDEVLKQSGQGLGGPGAVFGEGQYYVSFLGTPSETDPWILQWGGHHLALNITFDGANEVLTPSHTGCQPCTYIVKDQEVAVLGDEWTKAHTLLNALDSTQQATAILDYSVTDLVDGPGEEDRVLEPEGIPGSQLTADQQTMLLDLISEWVDIAPDAAAQTRMAEIKANINDTYFAWSGSTSADDTSAYFRVTGPTLLIEFAPQGTGGGGQGGPSGTQEANGTQEATGTQQANSGMPDGTPPAGFGAGGGASGMGGTSDNPTAAATLEVDLGSFSVVTDTGALYHVHTIYRDPTNAYGAKLTSGS